MANKVEEMTFLKVGPIGKSGYNHTEWDLKGDYKISQIFISSDKSYITSFQYQYIEGGRLKLSPLFGQHNGRDFHTVSLNGGSEYITMLSGTYDWFNNKICTLSIETSVRSYGPIGTNPTQSVADFIADFSIRFGPRNQICGFFGSFAPGGVHLSSIGVYTSPYLNLKAETS